MPASQHVLTFPDYVRNPLMNMNTFIALVRAMNTYGVIPKVE